ncbi:SGNH/GDSL hydrolase family protein [Desulfofustis limnaeus]|uniref:SGNH hydrolase-type esterase domain-containing protein n=1 Tax=Desulfofustis limnaeus TaxID=2740163 RepID=A0ABN6M7T3_9BACT|nr:SGNH/GDSL hydrolase family protein [Desulfofustis limnaeus]BDD87658.1 hypothetical protein DPPLL_20230 [Desulfofustis limnaeus]
MAAAKHSGKKIARKLPILMVSICALLVAGEWFARFVLGLGDPPLSTTHPRIEYMYTPDQDVQRFGNRFLVNGYGMRSEPFAVHKGEDELRLLVFGDSVVNGGNLTDHENLATTLLKDELFSLAGGRKVVVGNVSAGSWGPGNWLAYSQTYGFFGADVVVLVVSSHDVCDSPTFTPLDPITHPSKKPLSALSEGITRYLPRYVPIFMPDRPVVQDKKECDRARGLADLSAFLLAARSAGAALMVVHWPERDEVAAVGPESGFADLGDLARELGVKSVEAAPSVAAALDNGASVYRDNIHPDEGGQRVLAEVLRSGLSSLIDSARQ